MPEQSPALSPSDLAASWGALAAHLLATEKSLSWGATHSSFSSWLSDRAKEIKRSEATLWRALAAGRYYNELCAEFAGRGVSLHGLDSPSLAASPEALELAEKLSRVAPAEVVQQITQQVVDGKISRRELRSYWETYRSVLQGQTARGRNVVAPRFNARNIDMISSRLEADCIAGLIKDGSAWLGTGNAYIYKVIPITEPLAKRLDVRCVPDVIVIFQADAKSALELHGVEATSRPDDNGVVRQYRTHGLGVDFFWVATPTETESHGSKSCPELGFIEANPAGVKLVRKAARAKQDREAITNTLRGLLAREVVA